MSQDIVIVDPTAAAALLGDAEFDGHLFTEPYDPATSQATIAPLEGAMAERFGCSQTSEGFYHLSFALDSTWKMLNGLYSKQQTARPQHLYAGYDAAAPDMVTATYILPFGAIGQANKAAELICTYTVKEVVSRGKTYSKLGRHTMGKGIVTNPFYIAPKPEEAEYPRKVTAGKIMSSYQRRGNFGTL